MTGSVDRIDCGVVSGWAIDPANPSTRLRVTISVADKCIASVEAAQFRQDLVNAGHADGRSGFGVNLTEEDWRLLLESPCDVRVTATNPQTSEQVYLHFSKQVTAFLSGKKRRKTFLSQKEPSNIQLAAVCIIKNEAQCVEEWIAYHLIRGVQFFIFYDNGSSDNLHEVLAPYIRRGIAKIISWPNFVSDPSIRRQAWHEQVMAYAHALRMLSGVAEWVCILDIDEFIATRDGISITSVLENLNDRDIVTLYWRFYGSSGHDSSPAGLVIENYVRRQYDTIRTEGMPFKFIARPQCVGWLVNTHLPVLAQDEALGETFEGRRFWTPSAGSNAADFSSIWINHYHVKSREDYRKKVIRGWPENTDSKNFDWMGFFNLHDVNDVYDPILAGEGPAVRKIINDMRAITEESSEIKGMKSLVVTLDVFQTGEHIMITGTACDLERPGARVKIVVKDIFGASRYAGLCDLPDPSLDALGMYGNNYGFSIALPQASLPYGQVCLTLDEATFVRRATLPKAEP